jgi:Predicted pyridoxal phosphate-dependent enzyme apparently involved in regulation of cell wall biogenesis
MNSGMDEAQIVSLLKQAVNYKSGIISLHEPMFSGREWEYVKDCIDTGWVSSVGKYVDLFETKVAAFTGAQYAIAAVNGTAALHLCLRMAGVGPGDEVLMPAFTFVATANAVSYCGAIPHFIDINSRTLCADAEKLDSYLKRISKKKSGACHNKLTGRTIRAMIVVHTFGHPADIDPLRDVSENYGIELVEDAAEALGSYYKGKHVGTFGKVASLSFNGNKIVTTGGGGALLTDDPKIAERAKHLSTTAKRTHPWAFIHDRIGYNYRMPNINAALGCAQLEQIQHFLQCKRKLAMQYRRIFEDQKGITVFQEADYGRSNYWLNALILSEEYEGLRDSVLKSANEQGIQARPPWTLLNRLDMYDACPCMDLRVSESLERRIINVPSSACLGADLHV